MTECHELAQNVITSRIAGTEVPMGYPVVNIEYS